MAKSQLKILTIDDALSGRCSWDDLYLQGFAPIDVMKDSWSGLVKWYFECNPDKKEAAVEEIEHWYNQRIKKSKKEKNA